MVIEILYLLAFLNLLVGTGAIYLSLIDSISVKWHYYHYFIRKPLSISIFIFTCFFSFYWGFSISYFIPLTLTAMGVVLSFRMHQEKVFDAVDFPKMSNDPTNLSIQEDAEIALIKIDGVAKAYPLKYVEHHHIINDKFGSKIISLTYCAMCRSIVPFDVTEIGPLFVAGFKNANMVVADRKTVTYFQQSTYNSMIGKLHPSVLESIPFQIMKWKDIKKLDIDIQVVSITKSDLREFELPIPGIWKKILNSESTPGLSKKKVDKTYSARTKVIGIKSNESMEPLVYLKSELLKKATLHNKVYGFFLLAINEEILAFNDTVNDEPIQLSIDETGNIKDSLTNTVWDLSGTYIRGTLNKNLTQFIISDEYWFSWKFFHPTSKLIHP